CYLAKPSEPVIFELSRPVEFVGFGNAAAGFVIFDVAGRTGWFSPDSRESSEDAAIRRVIFIFGHARRGFRVERIGDADEVARIVIAVFGHEAAVNNHAAVVIYAHVGSDSPASIVVSVTGHGAVLLEVGIATGMQAPFGRLI